MHSEDQGKGAFLHLNTVFTSNLVAGQNVFEVIMGLYMCEFYTVMIHRHGFCYEAAYAKTELSSILYVVRCT